VTERCEASATAVEGRWPTATAPRRDRVAASIRYSESLRFPTTATSPRVGTSASPAVNSCALESASVTVSTLQRAPPCQASRYTRLVPPPLAHTVSRQSRPERASPSHAALSGSRHTTPPASG